jgi:hypothetical protein
MFAREHQPQFRFCRFVLWYAFIPFSYDLHHRASTSLRAEDFTGCPV